MYRENKKGIQMFYIVSEYIRGEGTFNPKYFQEEEDALEYKRENNAKAKEDGVTYLEISTGEFEETK
jgi:hypothetical protein